MCLQESTVIMCAHKASGDPTVQSAVPVRTAGPALPRTAHVCAHLDTEAPPAKEVRLPSFSMQPLLIQKQPSDTEDGAVTNSIMALTLF